MSNNPFTAPLCGIVPPMITPLTDRDTLEVAGLERLIEHILGADVRGLFILGTSGEGTSLSYRLRRELIERTCRQVAGRVRVLVGITDTAFVESVNLARHSADCGADAVVLTPPYYMPEGQPELCEYLDHIVAELPLPMFLYNMPPLTKVPFELDTIRHAMDHPGIVGLKDSSGDMIYFHRVRSLLSNRPDWTLLVGPEELLAESVLLGGHGGVNGGANIFPSLYVALYQAARDGQMDRVHTLHALVRQVADRIFRVGKHPSAVIKGMKCALSCLGICSDFMAEPFHKFRPPERLQIEQAVRELSQQVADIKKP
jgi:4-hydroxy-tetrahydrodipicolinate synthase